MKTLRNTMKTLLVCLCLLCWGCKTRPPVQEHKTECCCDRPMQPPKKP